MNLVVRNLAEPQSGGSKYENVNRLASWMTEMLEGNELDEPMTLAVILRFTLRDMMERGERNWIRYS